MAKPDLAAQWLRDNDPKAVGSKQPKRPRVKYSTEPVPEPQDGLDAAASKRHGKAYRKHGRQGAPKVDGPYCQKALWLKARVNFDREECLFFPGSHPGFVQQVRFNYRQTAASRAMCIRAHGLPNSEGMLAIHSCGNGHLSCVNPKHLRWGTTGDNAKDEIAHRGKSTAAERLAAVTG